MKLQYSKIANAAVLIVSLCFSLGLAEGVLWFAEKKLGATNFQLLKVATYENFYYHHRATVPAQEPPAYFNRLLAWTPANLNDDPDNPRVTINKQGYRSVTEYHEEKGNRRRIAFAGDSFTWAGGVPDEETPPAHLQKLLGEKYEVMNFGVGAYGFDQIVLTATEVVPKYHPDIIITAFPDDDLRRSCYQFQYFWKKPYFELAEGKLVLKGVPVPSPYETYMAHQPWPEKVKDAFWTHASRLRTLGLVAQLFLQPKLEACKSEINAALLTHLREKTPKEIHIVVALLEGKVPEKFETTAKSLDLKFLKVEEAIPRISDKTGLAFGRLPPPDRHPNASGNLIYAYALYEVIAQIDGLPQKAAYH